MEIINTIKAEILENLGIYTFLTLSQFQRLTGKSATYLREQLAILSQKKLIKSTHIEVAGVRLENIYHLSEAGKEVLIEHEKVFAENIRIPTGATVVRDYTHRKNYTTVKIELYELLRKQQITVQLFLNYFDKSGNNRVAGNLESKTKISLGDEFFFMPDGILITEKGEHRTLYLIEMYNGKDTGRTINQIAKHTRAISLGTPGQKFGIQDNPKILCAFEHEASKQAVIQRLQNNERFTSYMGELFFFASLKDIVSDCSTAWKTIVQKSLVFM